MTIGTPALIALVGGAMCAGGLLALGACLIWLVRHNPYR